MIALNHVLTGEAIALAVKRTIIAVPLAFLSHFVVDAIPHFGNVPFYTPGNPVFPFIVVADVLLAIASVFIVCHYAKNKTWHIVACSIAAALPDAFWALYYAQGEPSSWFYNFHQNIQWCEQPFGIITELAYTALLIWIIVKIIKRQHKEKALPKKR